MGTFETINPRSSSTHHPLMEDNITSSLTMMPSSRARENLRSPVHARNVAVPVVRAVSRARALTSGGQSGPGLLVTWSRVTQRVLSQPSPRDTCHKCADTGAVMNWGSV